MVEKTHMHTPPGYESLFYAALRIRIIEERIAELYPSDRIQSPVHLSIGQEQVSVGLCANLSNEDLVFGNYRGHALYLAKGGSLNRMMAELFGKTTGCGGGKAGSMHLSDASIGMMGSSAIVASTIPHAVGAALAAKIRKTGQVIVTIYGEGATGEGVYHESLNFAALHQLPILFVCENNGLAIYSRFSDLHAYKITNHGEAYGIPGKQVAEGWDLEKVTATCAEALRAVREGAGPRLLEIATFRYRQHVGPKEDYELGYRSREEYEHWKAKDPLVQRADLIQKFRPKIEAEIDQAIQFAETSDFPGSEALLNHVR